MPPIQLPQVYNLIAISMTANVKISETRRKKTEMYTVPFRKCL